MKKSDREIVVIAAVAEDGSIGKKGALIARIPEDMRRFRALTMGHAVVMGRRTFESLPGALPGRQNIVVTRNVEYKAEGAVVVHSLRAAIEVAGMDSKVYVIGGGQIYRQAMRMATRLEITRVRTEDADADTHFPKIPKRFRVVGTEPGKSDFYFFESYASSEEG